MKKYTKYGLLAAAFLVGLMGYSQNRNLDNFRSPDKNGVNVFEAPKDTVSTFDGIKVRVGGSSTLQFQAIDHENSGAVELIPIGDNFNLATANLDLDVALAKGVRMHLRTYLSSRHHPEPYVKGGYFQVDNLDFISPGFLEEAMKYLTIKVGHMENNYGDAHFRRTDNAQAMHNPFVGNLIMDAFTTEVGGEVYFRKNGFIAMFGLSNGKLNQAVNNPETTGASILAKLGYDAQVSEDLRLRLTGSMYSTGKSGNVYLYSADRSGSRYYLVMEDTEASTSGNFRSGRYNPGLRNEITAFMINPFVKYKGLEFFGTFETASGKADAETDDRTATQLAGELIYRFGGTENFFVGTRYNTVTSDDPSGSEITIDRFQLGGGVFLTKNILAKIEYVNQQYDGYDTTSIFHDGEFKGLLLEAVISF
ncbi:MAG TPA: hypothetical protein DEF18_04090 [Muricauda sp.]|uniref:Porin n=1 Tax=Flagellimonas aurea TaxID=2915619 RepID=A0ABS3G1W1_9FLAO|nr:hypothetical protein [Allomuricauda aurea]MBO0353399.1 hypothetical protein [Allomuricauda aurea]UBZ13480.1 hypothetical protein LDL77_16540 [Allomuricauda aquimarina]HBU77259.1 hypothetical protein [Allomuricauda sp.]|tara:strand:+ start:369 stop:1631 length:1263 start_codon:yes stop_codon:yes gene_type:complete